MIVRMSSALSSLRPQLRRQRRQISIYQQRQSAQRIEQQIRGLAQFQHAKKVGLYLDAFGEIQTSNLIELCFQLGKQVYLPKICNMNQHLVWIKISRQQWLNRRFYPHRLGMLEPMATRGCPVKCLDLLLMPLLGCDRNGIRLGMGGGFYDRTLSRASRRPYRLGLAHEFQFIEINFPYRVWDQPLNGLLTPHKFRCF